VVPVFYLLLAGRTKPTSHVAELINRLEREEAKPGAPAGPQPQPAE
jgi:hypothetical protein